MLAVRFMVQDRGAGPALWERITSPTFAHAPLDGEPALHHLIAGRRLQSASAFIADDDSDTDGGGGPSGGGGSSLRRAAGKEWEWGLFSAEDRSRFISIGPYMNAAVYSVTEACPLSRAYRLFRRYVTGLVTEGRDWSG